MISGIWTITCIWAPFGQADFTAEVKQPPAFAKPGYYPTSYTVKFDSANREYIVSLDGLSLRKAKVVPSH